MRFLGHRPRAHTLSLVLLASLFPACGASDSSDSKGASVYGGANMDNNTGGTGTAGGIGSGGTGGAVYLPPEVELNANFELPKAGQRFVYSVNPTNDTVAVIDATTLTIETVDAGDAPTFLQTLAGTDTAIVLNVGSSDATVIRSGETGSLANHIPVIAGANAIAVAPGGKHAVVYYNALFKSAGQTSGSFQDVSILTLATAGDSVTQDSVMNMTIGFRPRDVFFSADGLRAFVVTEDGISVLDFAALAASGPGIAPPLPLGSVDSADLDVSITPDGLFALARQADDSTLRLLDLQSGALSTLDLASGVLSSLTATDAGACVPDTVAVIDAGADANSDAGSPDSGSVNCVEGGTVNLPPGLSVTDLDLSPSGDFALAVLRDASTVLRIPIPQGFTDPSQIQVTVIEDELIGSVQISPDDRFALLFTTADLTNERLTVLDLQTAIHTTMDVKKAVRSVAVAPNSKTALVIHNAIGGDPNEPGLDPDVFIDRSFGYSVVSLDPDPKKLFSKLQVNATDVGPFAIVPDGTFLFILFNSGLTREVQRVELANFFVNRIALGSPPISVGSVPSSKKVFVGQDHKDGRISFINWETADVQSVTGFELNSRIRE